MIEAMRRARALRAALVALSLLLLSLLSLVAFPARAHGALLLTAPAPVARPAPVCKVWRSHYQAKTHARGCKR